MKETACCMTSLSPALSRRLCRWRPPDEPLLVLLLLDELELLLQAAVHHQRGPASSHQCRYSWHAHAASPG